ncbi:MAG: DUF945 family protein [Burkholderiales bacterium]|nr:DUF945 family protein [Burkholderiales bacterium]
MNRKMWLGAGVGLAGLVAAAVGTVWWSGARAEHNFREFVAQVADNPSRPADLSIVRYDRGLLGASAVTRVTPRRMPQLVLELEHVIEHGPHPEFGWARITTTPHLSAEAARTLGPWFDGHSPLTVTTTFAFDGATHVDIVSPAFAHPGQAAWDGLTGSLDYPGDRQLVLALQAPRLQVEGPGGSFRAAGLKVDGHWTMAGISTLQWEGESRLALAEFTVFSPFGRFSVRDVALAGYQKDAGGMLTAGSTLRVAAADLLARTTPEPILRNGELAIDVSGIDQRALSDYMAGLARVDRASPAPDAYREETQQLVERLLDGVAAGKPQVRLRRLSLETPGGLLSASGALGLGPVELGAPEARGVTALTSRLQGSFTVEGGPGLVGALIARRMGPAAIEAIQLAGGVVEPASVEAMAQDLAAARLQELVAAGVLHEQDGKILLEVVVSDGEARWNGLTREAFTAALMHGPSAEGVLPPAPNTAIDR